MSENIMTVMIGLDANGTPHAARFSPGTDYTRVLEAAKRMSFHMVVPNSTELIELAASLREGQLFDTGKAFIPFTKRPIFDRFAALADEEIQPAPRSSAKPSKEKQTPAEEAQIEDFEGIGVGSVVLAHSSADSAWYEAVVTALQPDRVRLKWRDFPGEKPFTALVAHVVLAPSLD